MTQKWGSIFPCRMLSSPMSSRCWSTRATIYFTELAAEKEKSFKDCEIRLKVDHPISTKSIRTKTALWQMDNLSHSSAPLTSTLIEIYSTSSRTRMSWYTQSPEMDHSIVTQAGWLGMAKMARTSRRWKSGSSMVDNFHRWTQCSKPCTCYPDMMLSTSWEYLFQPSWITKASGAWQLAKSQYRPRKDRFWDSIKVHTYRPSQSSRAHSWILERPWIWKRTRIEQATITKMKIFQWALSFKSMISANQEHQKMSWHRPTAKIARATLVKAYTWRSLFMLWRRLRYSQLTVSKPILTDWRRTFRIAWGLSSSTNTNQKLKQILSKTSRDNIIMRWQHLMAQSWKKRPKMTQSLAQRSQTWATSWELGLFPNSWPCWTSFRSCQLTTRVWQQPSMNMA